MGRSAVLATVSWTVRRPLFATMAPSPRMYSPGIISDAPSPSQPSPRRCSTQLSLHGFALQLELPRLRDQLSPRLAASPLNSNIGPRLGSKSGPLPHRGRGLQDHLIG